MPRPTRVNPLEEFGFGLSLCLLSTALYQQGRALRLRTLTPSGTVRETALRAVS